MQNTFLLNHRSGILGSDCQSKKESPPTHQMILQSALHKYLELVVETLTKTAGFLTTKILLSWQLELQLECLLAALWRNLNPGQLQQKGAKSGHPSCFSSTQLHPGLHPNIAIPCGLHQALEKVGSMKIYHTSVLLRWARQSFCLWHSCVVLWFFICPGVSWHFLPCHILSLSWVINQVFDKLWE